MIIIMTHILLLYKNHNIYEYFTYKIILIYSTKCDLTLLLFFYHYPINNYRFFLIPNKMIFPI